MAQLLPESWRRALARLRQDIHRSFERWFARRKEEENGSQGRLALSRRDSVEELRTDINDILDLWSSPWRALEEIFPSSPAGDGEPVIDVEEADDEVIVTAELPGLDKKDFTVEVVGDRLVLRGERKHETEERKDNYYYSERSYGAFARIIGLPAEVDASKAAAKYKNGLLRISLPKTARAKAKRIPVAA
jgi:HSP20 family protein